MTRHCVLRILVSLVVIGAVARNCNGALVVGFYDRICPQATTLVRDATWNQVRSNPSLGAKLLRMHFHDCFVRGCDGSILLDSVGGTQAEKDATPNLSLTGFDVIDQIKTKVEQVCPNVVSCADILALAARDAVSYPFRRALWDVPTGRRDGAVSLASDVNGNIPSPFSDFPTLLQLFTSKGLDSNDLVALSGAHTIGVAHCATFSSRLYNFSGNGDTDPSLDTNYASFLKTKCPNPASTSITVEMDPRSSLSFDAHYFSNLLQNKGLLTSDAALLKNTNSAALVRRLQFSNSFFSEFAKSMVKMGAIGVITGTDGQIRKNCRLVN